MAKKKRKAKKPAQPGIDPNEKRRERLEAKRAAKAEAVAAQRKKEMRERIVRRVIMIGILGLAVWFLILRNVTPKEINGHTINNFSTRGANQHTTGTISYEDSPPVSGQHAPNNAPCGVHGDPIPNELMVHNLEHGAIGLLYQPTLELEQIRQLEATVAEYEHSVFSMPYQGAMESPIVISAWGHTMELQEVEEDSIEEFIEEFRRGGDAPEATIDPPCEHQDPEPFQPAEEGAEGASDEVELPEATASPDAEASPSPTE